MLRNTIAYLPNISMTPKEWNQAILEREEQIIDFYSTFWNKKCGSFKTIFFSKLQFTQTHFVYD